VILQHLRVVALIPCLQAQQMQLKALCQLHQPCPIMLTLLTVAIQGQTPLLIHKRQLEELGYQLQALAIFSLHCPSHKLRLSLQHQHIQRTLKITRPRFLPINCHQQLFNCQR
jgi:hypothetical protein